MTVAELTERELIARIQRRLPPAPEWLLVGPGDDSAVVEPERNRVEVLSVDCLVDTVHFDRKFVPADAIGHRALAVNLSDLAAMGASPRFALLSIALPKTLPVVDFDGIVDGVTALATRHRMHIAGGNLTSTPGPLTVDVTVVGTVKRRQALTRGGARPGDELYVTGAVGSARAALEQLRTGRTSALAAAYLRPEARLRVGTLLARNRVASACMDLSDGLADAVRQVAGASGVGAHIEADAVPIEPLAREWFEAQQQDPVVPALAGGDDYELLFAVRPHLRRRLAAVRRLADVPITRIGVCTAAPELVVSSSDGNAVPLPPGYGHFR
jgi:thiamine-monophosphate kinase